MEFIDKCFPHHELKEDLNIKGESEQFMFLDFVMIILLTFNSIDAIEKTVEPVWMTLSFTSFPTSVFDVSVINFDAPCLLLYSFSDSVENTKKWSFLVE